MKTMTNVLKNTTYESFTYSIYIYIKYIQTKSTTNLNKIILATFGVLAVVSPGM